MKERVNPFQINREFERMFFDGVPDHPEPTFGRDTFGQVTPRYSGKTHKKSNEKSNTNGVEILGRYEIDPETGEEKIVYFK